MNKNLQINNILKDNKISIFILFFLILLNGNVNALENKIIVKVNNNIITSLDIFNEVNYLSLTNKKFNQLEEFSKFQIAKNSLIRQNIQEIELLKNVKEINIDNNIYDKLIKNFYTMIGQDNYDNFLIHIQKNNIPLNIIKKKITIEVLWNQLIFRKFSSNVKIDQEKIKKDVLKNDTVKEYLLSEIVFSIDDQENLKEKLSIIKKKIDLNGFENTVLEYSISGSSKNNGNIGWIKEASLSSKVKNEIKKIKISELTSPITVPGGFLILKIRDIKEVKREINLEKEIEFIIRKKTNNQLSQYSNIYFNKIKKNITINEI